MARNSAEIQRRQVMAAVRRLEPEIAKAFQAAISAAATNIDFSALSAAIEAGDVDEILRLASIPENVLAQIGEQVRAAFSAGGAISAAQVPAGLAGKFLFDARHTEAERWVAQNVGKLIEGIEASSIESVRAIVTDGFESKRTTTSIARDITGRKVGNTRVGGVLGLNSDQTDSLINARHILSDPARIREYYTRSRKTGRMVPRYKLSDRRFDGLIKSAISEGRALSPSELKTVMDAHRDKALGYRGRVIAKDQTFNAIAAGRDQGFDQILERDDVKAVTKRWQHNLSENARLDHQAMDGTTIDKSEAFEFPDGTAMRYPHDQNAGADHTIGCRCIAIYRVVVYKPSDIPKPRKPRAKPRTPATVRAPVSTPPSPEPTQGAARFAYERFEGVNTTAQAESYIMENGIAEVVSLKGISAKSINQSLRAAHEVTERFGLQPLSYMGPISRDDRYRYRTPRNANAAVYYQTKALHLPTKFGNLAEAENQIRTKKSIAEKYGAERDEIISRTAGIDPEVVERAARMRPGDYTWSITMDDGAAERAKTMFHEYGHVIHKIDPVIGPKIDAFLASERPMSRGWPYLVSKYGGSNQAEYIAETFAIYMTQPETEFYRIHPKLLAIYQEADKKNDN